MYTITIEMNKQSFNQSGQLLCSGHIHVCIHIYRVEV